MSDTEDDSSTSDNSWPVNEAWLIDILTEFHKCCKEDIQIMVCIFNEHMNSRKQNHFFVTEF